MIFIFSIYSIWFAKCVIRLPHGTKLSACTVGLNLRVVFNLAWYEF